MRLGLVPPRGSSGFFEDGWSVFHREISRIGGQIEVLNHSGRSPFYPRLDGVVVFGSPGTVAGFRSLEHVPRRRRIQVVLEPRVTAPLTYSKRVIRWYGSRFAASPIWAESLNAESFKWPQNLTIEEMPARSNGTYDAVMISANKVSAERGSLYSLRLRIMRHLSHNGLSVGLAGPGWTPAFRDRFRLPARAIAKTLVVPSCPRPIQSMVRSAPNRLIIGPVEKKADAYRLSNVAIVIENSRDYVSEKLVDAVRHGRVPLYIGPPLSRFGIPKEVAIECSPSEEAVLESMRNLDQALMKEVQSAGRRWMVSDQAKEHESEFVQLELASRIRKCLLESGLQPC